MSRRLGGGGGGGGGGSGGSGGGSGGTTQQLWKMNDQRAQKSGPHRAVYFVATSKDAEGATSYEARGSYQGEWKENKREGFGVQVWASGGRYEGEWRGGRREGHGTLWVREGEALRKVYAGNWSADLRHGLGTNFYANGDRYEGEWAAGAREGRGAMFYANGDVYVGEWRADQRSGRGTLTMRSGDVYEGGWLGDRREGAGILFFRDARRVLEGEWAADVARCGVYTDAAEFAQNETERAALLEFDAPAQLPADAADTESADARAALQRKAERRRAQPLPPLALADAAGVLAEEVARVQAVRAPVRERPDAAALAASFSPAELDELRRVFASADAGDGRVAAAALSALLEEAGLPRPSPPRLAALLCDIGRAPADGIAFGEFVSAVYIWQRALGAAA